ncbi:hypothetical protein [Corynebacterium kalidii]
MTSNNAPQNQPNEPTTQAIPAATPEAAPQAKPRKKRKGLLVGAGAVAALLIAGGIGYGISDADDDTEEVRTVSAAENRGNDSDDCDDRDGRDDRDDRGAGDSRDTAGSDVASYRDAAEQAIAEAGGRGASSVSLEGNGHEVDVELDDGGSAEVHVSTDGAMRIETEGPDRFDQDDPTLDLAALDKIFDAALAASGEAGVRDGVVDSVSASDDRGVTYEVSVRGTDGREFDVDLTEDLSVVSTDIDD